MPHPRRYDISLEPDPVIEAYKKDVDRTLLRENLKLTPEERLLKLIELQAFAEEVRRAGAHARHDRTSSDPGVERPTDSCCNARPDTH
jgi:hypothetical protein